MLAGLCALRRFFIAFISALLLQSVNAANPTIVASRVPSSSGQTSSFALGNSGNLYGWGSDNYGQLGQGKLLNSATFLLAGGNFRTVSVSAHTNGISVAAIQLDNTLWTWGANSFGQLGDGTNVSKSKPVHVGDNFKSVVSASAFTLGIKLDGSLWMWGQGWFGDGTYSISSSLM